MARGSIAEHRARDGRVRFRVRGWLDGERHSLGVFDTRDEADDVLAAWLARYEDASTLTLGGWGEQWLDMRETDGAHRDAKTDRSRWRCFVAQSSIAHVGLRRLTRALVVKWLDEIVRRQPLRAKTNGDGETTCTPRSGRLRRETVKHALRLLSKSLNDAVDRGLLNANPAAGLKAPKVVDPPGQRWGYLEPEQIAALEALPLTECTRRRGNGTERAHITPAERSALVVAIYTGLRAGELWGLRWGDVRLDGDRPELRVERNRTSTTKSTKARHVPLFPQAAAALRSWRDVSPGIGEALVWPTDGSGSHTRREERCGGCHDEGYDAGWKRIRTLVGSRIRFHDLRHTTASHLVMGTWTLPLALIQVRDWLGHESIKTTERYAHLAPGGLHDAVRAGQRVGNGGHPVDTGGTHGTNGKRVVSMGKRGGK